MKHICYALKYICSLLLILLVFIACDKDYSSIKSDVLGEDNFNFNASKDDIPILVYNKNLETQQINGFGANLLGVHDDPDFGTTAASIITQVTPSSFSNIDFGEEVKIESVILTIPYYSTLIRTEEGKPIYKLDSLFVENNDPAKVSPIKLSVYENTYFLSDVNPSSPNALNYFSKADGAINTTHNFAVTEGGTINFDDHIGQVFVQDSIFTISSEPRSTGSGEDKIYSTPAIVLDLAADDTNKAFWKSLIIDQEGMSTLSNANNFKNHFRGLYIKAEAENDKGSMVLLNLLDTDANVVLNYSKKSTTEGEDRTNGTYTMTFNGNRLNTFINDYDVLPTNPDQDNGDEKLYLKGTEGAIAVLELFSGLVDCDGDGNVDDSALECFKKTFRKTDEDGNVLAPINGQYQLKRLINEAILVVYEDETIYNVEDPNGDPYHTYDRLLIYNLENNTPIIDYASDPTANTAIPLISRSFSLGVRKTDDDGFVKYKLRLTDHLNNILINNTENPKLGLVLSNNVNLFVNSPVLNSDDDVSGTPSTTLIAPRGTILYGNNVSADKDKKRMKLELFFTEPKGLE